MTTQEEAERRAQKCRIGEAIGREIIGFLAAGSVMSDDAFNAMAWVMLELTQRYGDAEMRRQSVILLREVADRIEGSWVEPAGASAPPPMSAPPNLAVAGC